MSFTLQTTSIPGVMMAATSRLSDHRGSFGRLFCDRALEACLGSRSIVQINHSRTARAGAIRGLHYQMPPHAEMKMVRCLRGAVLDVAVDLRRGSPTFLRWYSQQLTPENALMLVIPEGCAHGFQALEPDSELLYLHTAHYVPEAEGGVAYDDPRLGIVWPLPVLDLSSRDLSHAPLPGDFKGIELL